MAKRKLIYKLGEKGRKPTYTRKGDACLDLYAATVDVNTEKGYVDIDTQFHIALKPTEVALIFPRSGSSGNDMQLGNCVGVIDSNYRGAIRFRYRPYLNTMRFIDEALMSDMRFNHSDEDGELDIQKFIPHYIYEMMCKIEENPSSNYEFKEGDRIGQMLIIDIDEIELDDNWPDDDETVRGDDGFGSSGR